MLSLTFRCSVTYCVVLGYMLNLSLFGCIVMVLLSNNIYVFRGCVFAVVLSVEGQG